MIILGVNSDDKGAQLEALVSSTLRAEGYDAIEGNVIGAGGDELDVTAELRSTVVTREHVTPVICEAKAYGKPVVLPIWHKFLGKIFIARTTNARAIGVLIALNGVSGNVRGNFNSLDDTGLMIVDGRDLETRAIRTGEILDETGVVDRVRGSFSRDPDSVEVAYYGGRYYRIVRWSEESYSVADGRGEMLPVEQLERIQDALSASISGELLATAEARAHAEKQHAERVRLIGRLVRGQTLTRSDMPTGHEQLFDELAQEPFLTTVTDALSTVEPSTLPASAVARFFECIFQSVVPVGLLGFVADGLHEPYVERLIDSLPDLHPGLSLDTPGKTELHKLAPFFPSIWMTIARPDSFLTAQFEGDEAGESNDADERVVIVNRNAFWEQVIAAIRSDFINPNLRGFLFDHLHVAELEEHRTLTVKTWEQSLGSASAETRDALGRLSDELVGSAGTGHVVIRVLSTMNEPWDMLHPDPVVELEDRQSADADGTDAPLAALDD